MRRIKNFSSDEVSVARDLLAEASREPDGDYRALVAEPHGSVAGYVCYGQTPMTRTTWDMYWLACAPTSQRRGLGRALVGAMEADVLQRGGTLIRVETGGADTYLPTRAFYRSTGYLEEARVRDFYRDGDDLVVFTKRF